MRRRLERGTTTPLVIQVLKREPLRWWTVSEIHTKIDRYGMRRRNVADALRRLTLSGGPNCPPVVEERRPGAQVASNKTVVKYRWHTDEYTCLDCGCVDVAHHDNGRCFWNRPEYPKSDCGCAGLRLAEGCVRRGPTHS